VEFNIHKPIYLQIVDYIHDCIITETLPVGEKLPSVRELAVKMSVTPNTANRACAILQQQAVVTAKRGVGLFVHEQSKARILTLKKKRFIDQELPNLFKSMTLLDISAQELLAQYEQFQNQSSNSKPI
jgi:DNA-binding transcriptional regulator YhcF (GntR family)